MRPIHNVQRHTSARERSLVNIGIWLLASARSGARSRTLKCFSQCGSAGGPGRGFY
jgi:hypothetical protein